MFKGVEIVDKSLDKLENEIIETKNGQLRNALRELRNAMIIHGVIDDKKYPIFWNIDEVVERAKQNGVVISSSEAHEILEFAVENHDKNIGLNWTVIDELILKWSNKQ